MVCRNEVTGTRANGIFLRGVNTVTNADSSQSEITDPVERNTLCYNDLHDLHDSGIYITYLSNSNLVYGNKIGRVAYEVNTTGDNSGGNGIHIANGSGNNRVHDNVVHTLDTHGISMRQGAHDTLVYNNTIYDVGRKITGTATTGEGDGIDIHMSGVPTTYGYNQNNYVFNNVVSIARTACFNLDDLSISSGSSNVFDFNLCYNPTGSPNGIASGALFAKHGSTDYVSVSSATATTDATTGHRQHQYSLQVDPQMNNPLSEDFSFSVSSAIRNYGIADASPLQSP